mgnify:FL=1
MFFKNNFDFVAIGETTIDAFIRLKEATVRCDANNENCQLCVNFGAKIPYESVTEVVAVGNAGNASVSASRLGLKSALVANVGPDDNGKKCINSLKKDGVNTDFVIINPDKDTNYHYVLWYEKERTILQKHSNFDYKLPDIGETKWIYLTSLGENSLPLHKEILEYLKKHPETKMAFQPGIFQIKFGKDALKEIYEATEVFFCNVEEARTILGNDEHDVKKLMEEMRKLGPKIVVITDGINGAYAHNGENYYFMPVYPHQPFERTGAGDAFSSTFVVALAMGKSIEESLMMAPINSMSVVQHVGAQEGLLTLPEIEKFLQQAPDDYKPRRIN